MFRIGDTVPDFEAATTQGPAECRAKAEVVAQDAPRFFVAENLVLGGLFGNAAGDIDGVAP